MASCSHYTKCQVCPLKNRSVPKQFTEVSQIQATGNQGGHKTTFHVFSKSWFKVFSIKTTKRNTWRLYQNKLGSKKKPACDKGLWDMGTSKPPFPCQQGHRGTGGPTEARCTLSITCYRRGSEVSCPLAMGDRGLLPQLGLFRDLNDGSSQSRGMTVAHMFHLIFTTCFRQELATLLPRVLIP